jgi:three-Cys-motif partner protein
MTVKFSIRNLGYSELLFVEKNKNNYENLKKKVEDYLEEHRYEGINIQEIINDEFINVAPHLTKIGYSAPSFFFIDPFGWSGVPFRTIKEILTVRKTEVFLNFMVRDMNRFLTYQNHKVSISDFFGINNVESVIKNQYSDWTREYALLDLYKKQLQKEAGVDYVLSYQVCADETSQTTYYLIHATNYPLGCEVMKTVMYKAGTEGRFCYLGPQNGQMDLMRYSDSLQFQNYLMEKFKGRKISYQKIRYETLTETKFIQKPAFGRSTLKIRIFFRYRF